MALCLVGAVAIISLGVIVSSQSCDEPHYERCLKQLHEFAERHDLIFATTKEELQTNCVQAQSALSCLTRYSRKCIPLDFREEFLSKIAGAQSVVTGLCIPEGSLRKRYLEALPCLQNYSGGIQYCNEKFHRNLRDITVVDYENKLHLQCCSFSGYRRCLRMLLHERTECSDVVDELVFRSGGDFSSKECTEHFERCTGSGTWNFTPNLVLVFLMFVSVYKTVY